MCARSDCCQRWLCWLQDDPHIKSEMTMGSWHTSIPTGAAKAMDTVCSWKLKLGASSTTGMVFLSRKGRLGHSPAAESQEVWREASAGP